MESKKMEASKPYVKSDLKILLRFIQQMGEYLGRGKVESAFKAISLYPKYKEYTKITKFPYELGVPWINHQAFIRLKEILHPEMDVLEFGSGGSTIFFRDKVNSVFSIEHDKKWFDEIEDQFKEWPNVTLNLIEPEEGESYDEAYSSVNGIFSEGKSYKRYVHAADHLEEASIDLLVIDGRARPECLKQTISKLKSGGVLLFDNSDRSSYKESITKHLKGWKREVYSGVTLYDWRFNETSLFFKP